MKSGKVYLVGAGPGDSGLLTRKGESLIKRADVILYDKLVGDGVLSMIPKGTETIDVGKSAGVHKKQQDEINRILCDEAKKGKQVVRLKGGDPFMFGRGGEELELLVRENIPFEVVPGVTSFLAVPSYNGIPVTHRDFVSSLHIITGHQKDGAVSGINFKALVEAKGTLIFLMGVKSLQNICDSLLAAGMEADMPAAILQRGTTANQKRIVATVQTLSDEVKRQGVETPAIIMVGKVCTLADEFFWYEKLPLFGIKIVLTRPEEKASVTAERLYELGAEVISIPSIHLEPLPKNAETDAAFASIASYQWLVFTSPKAVKVFFELLKSYETDIRKLANIKIAVVGKGTKKELLEHGFYPDLMPEHFDGISLGKALSGVCGEHARVLIPRAKIGSNEIINVLTANKNICVTDIAIYDTIYETNGHVHERSIFKEDNSCAVFTSASTVKGFVEATKGLDYKRVNAICIGRQTKSAADAYQMKTTMAENATIDGLVKAVKAFAERKSDGDN